MSWYLRRMSREWVEKYPSIGKMSDNITGLRRMGSPATVNGYIQGIRRFIEHLGYDNPETALEKIRSGEVDAFEALNQQGSGFISHGIK